MKIVINSCYGGFGLSTKGFREYLRRKGKPLFAYSHSDRSHRTLVKWDEEGEEPFFVYHFMQDNGPEILEFKGGMGLISYRDIKRDDEDLVKTVEALGKEASGKYADLQVIEIPDGVAWEIEEYDGQEWVSETHRTWR